MTMLILYTLSNCDTCRKATKWLRAAGIAFEERAIRETPPAMEELRTMLKAQGNELRKLFNTSGREYREQKMGEKLATMSEDEALASLAANGSLVKRPFAVGDGVALVGFDEAKWKQALGGR